jgi:hypothetical protein
MRDMLIRRYEEIKFKKILKVNQILDSKNFRKPTSLVGKIQFSFK